GRNTRAVDDHRGRVAAGGAGPGTGAAVTRVLCYHDVVGFAEREQAGFPGPVSARYKLSPERFERHLDALESAGMRPGLLDQRPEVTLTFDDGGASALAIAG